MSKLTTVSSTEESKELKNKIGKDCKRKFLITISVILFVEAPQVISAWISIAEELSLFLNHHSLPDKVIQHPVK